ncbi:MAG: iron-sulfur cluster assembly scaffold protein [Candidatus Absconditabacteria bacterium]|nr:iron-sulfur cluster assembly scaffold protein [Candidatus Absconditabacteria bacterium]
MEELNVMLQEYAKNPICNFAMKDYTIKQHEGNFICGDDIIVYLRIDKNVVLDYSFDGNCSTITVAAASILSEIIVGSDINDILTRGYSKMLSLGFEVSPRRKRAAVIAILAARNAIHKYLNDGKEDTFDDLFDD